MSDPTVHMTLIRLKFYIYITEKALGLMEFDFTQKTSCGQSYHCYGSPSNSLTTFLWRVSQGQVQLCTLWFFLHPCYSVESGADSIILVTDMMQCS